MSGTWSVHLLGQRVGRHHFIYLRSIAEGVPAADAARRFLGLDHAAAVKAAHRLVVERVRSIARRRGDRRWRLLGLEIHDSKDRTSDTAPPLEEWAAAEGLDGWSQTELQDMYVERFGAPNGADRRRAARNGRLRAQRLALLRDLEASASETATAGDALAGWLPEPLVAALQSLGDLTLGDLRSRIAKGGRWWRGLPSYGPRKARTLAAYVATLIGPSSPPAWSLQLAGDELQRLSGCGRINRMSDAAPAIDATDDMAAVRAWISARAGSAHTARQYEREAERFLLWCVLERRKPMSDASAEDCRAYMDFLADVPDAWISRCKLPRLAPGWAPFRGALSKSSQQIAIDTLAGLFSWLVQARYIAGNPWVLLNRRLGDTPQADDAASRAFTPQAWTALLAWLDAPDNRQEPSSTRLRWLCVFLQAVGLRAGELIRAERGHLTELRSGWVLKVHGKGRRNRTVPVPRTVVEATRAYFASRGLDFDSAPTNTRLLASLADGAAPITYSALHQTFTRFARRAIADSTLPLADKRHALKASTHWLRHTHATRAAERNVPPDVLQENLGQADPRTTARYYRAQLERRQKAIEQAFG
jgi:integrase